MVRGVVDAHCRQGPAGRRVLASNLRNFVNFSVESAMPLLAANRTFIDLAPARPSGLNSLGVPLQESSVVKKGKLHEFTQALAGGKIGRRFQNLRVTAIRTAEGGLESTKLFVEFEVFGDDNLPLAANSGFDAVLYAGSQPLLALAPGSVFLPYACFWYENRFVFDLPAGIFDEADRLEFIAKPDQVRSI